VLGSGTPLATPDISQFFANVDFSKLASQVSDETNVPQTGAMDRIMASHFETEQGAVYTEGCNTSANTSANACLGWLRGRLQPYAIYVPPEGQPAGGYGTTLLLHSLGANYNQFLASKNQSQFGDRGPGSIVLTAAGRGPEGWYYGYAASDTFEMWADAAARYTLDPEWTAISGYSMGGYATFKLGAQFPDLFAKGQPVVGPPAQGIWAPPSPPQPGGDRSNTNRMLASFWNVPFLIWNGTQDELVNAASAQAQADEFAAQGLRYEWDLFTTSDHFALAINDEYGPAANFLGTTEVNRNPPRVKYAYNPTMDFATGQLVGGHAYWLSNITLANGSGTAPLGTIDVNSHGFGVGNPTTATGTGAGALTGGQAPMAYSCQSQNWGTAPAPGSCDGLSTNLPSTRPLDSFDINGTNVSNVTINARRASLTCNATHNSTSVNITMNNCPAVGTLSVSDQSVTEGNGGTTNMTFTVNLSDNTENLPVSILYQTQNGSASSSSDYDSTSGTLTFGPGETSKQVNVPIHGDTSQEGDETFTLQLTDGQFATPTSLSATGTITNDDAPEPPASIAGIPNDNNLGTNTKIPCVLQSGGNAGERHCSGIFTTFDGAPIDINVGFPAAPASGPDGDYPVVGVFHGWGGSKASLTSSGMQQWLDDGYAVFSMSDRGWGNSCGGTDPKRLQPVCANGYNHLMDTRFEVRDAQEVWESLADEPASGATSGEGLINPQKIGPTGGSYGGGISMALGALKNRKMVNESDPEGDLVAWTSPGGKSMRIAAAQPDIPWTDLAYSLQPNGHTLDYVADAPYMQRGRIGVMKQSFVAGLYATGQATSNYAPPGTDPDADLTTWYAEINAGEPYDTNPLSADIVDEITTHHSSYYIDDSTAPAPMLISNGWTDDLFPPDEAIRFYNRTRTNHPGTPISLMFSDHGHQRGQNKVPDGTFRNGELHKWFDYYIKGQGSQPYQGVQTLTQTCGGPSGGATGAFDNPNTDEPFRASRWRDLAKGEVRFSGAAQQIISPTASDTVGQAFDPIAGGGACASASSSDQTGTATYRLPAAPAGGYTLMGSPTIIADINSVGPHSQIAARLLDVNGANETLVARALYRPEINSGTAPTRQVFQLHPNGWKFEAGHVAKLELLPADQPYGRNSNGQLPVTINNLELRLPVLEEPGGPVDFAAPKVVPPGYELARDYAIDGYARPKAATPINIRLVPAYEECNGNDNATHGAPLAVPSCNPANLSSDYLTVGTPESNGKKSMFSGVLTLKATGESPIDFGNGDQSDVQINVSITDVRKQSDLTDYTGELRGVLGLRITDTQNGEFQDYPGTATDSPLAFNIGCAATAGDEGGACNVATTADAVMADYVREGKRAVWGIGQFEVYDGGADGDADTTGDNTLFATPGLFAP
jgi:predicted esterase